MEIAYFQSQSVSRQSVNFLSIYYYKDPRCWLAILSIDPLLHLNDLYRWQQQTWSCEKSRFFHSFFVYRVSVLGKRQTTFCENPCGSTEYTFISHPSLQLVLMSLSWINVYFSGAAAYQFGNTSSRTITEVKQRWARLVLGWATVQVLPECCC